MCHGSCHIEIKEGARTEVVSRLCRDEGFAGIGRGVGGGFEKQSLDA